MSPLNVDLQVILVLKECTELKQCFFCNSTFNIPNRSADYTCIQNDNYFYLTHTYI